MEHHSNQTSWLETIADVAVIPLREDWIIKYENLEILLEKYKDRSLKLRQLLLCSNVRQERLIKGGKNNASTYGLCFVDFVVQDLM
jgi:hypothetical protein